MYMQRNIPSPNRTYDFSIKNFTGGLNNRSMNPGDNQAVDILNIALNDEHVMERRKGTTYFDAMNISEPVTFVDEFKPYGSESYFLRASNNYLWMGLSRIHSLSGLMTGVNYEGKYFFTDGSGLYCLGSFPQVNADPYVKVQGTPSSSYMVMEVVSPPVEGVTPLGSEHVKGVTVYNYTQKTIWYEPCEAELQDTFKQGNVVLPNAKFIVVKENRLYVAGSDRDANTVYISDILNPFYFPAACGVSTPPNSDEIVGLSVFNDSVIIGRNSDVYHITGNTNRTDIGGEVFRLRSINSHTGFASNQSICTAHNYLFFLGKDGNAYAMNSSLSSSGELATTILNRDVNFFEKPIAWKKEELSKSCSIFFENNWYISLGDKVVIYNYLSQGWTVYNNLEARSFFERNGVLLWGTEFGLVSMVSEDYTDYRNPYLSLWKSKVFDMDDPLSYKFLKNFFLVSHTFDDLDSNIFIAMEVDYAEVKNYVEVKSKIPKFGESRFGDMFASININSSSPFPVRRRGRGFSFLFRSGYEELGAVASEAELYEKRPFKNFDCYRLLDLDVHKVYMDGTWSNLLYSKFNQPMRIYQLNGEYEARRKR